MSAADALLPSPAPAVMPQVPCERCGTFTEETVKVGARKVCAPCSALLRKELRLYPYVYMNVVGSLLNFTIAAVLSAINWKRLGEPERMLKALIIGGFGVAWTVAVMVFDISTIVTLALGIALTRVATQGLKEPCEEHWKAGGARANRLWPLLITFGLFAAVLGVVVAVAYAADIPDEAF